jgi:hypothetical protein
MRPTHRLLVPAEPRRIAMVPFAALSRRALVAAAAFVAMAPSAEARTRKPPQAFVTAILSSPSTNGSNTFGYAFQMAVAHPASDTADEVEGSIFIDSNLSATAARAEIIKDLKATASGFLGSQGHSVPADRIAVTLF